MPYFETNCINRLLNRQTGYLTGQPVTIPGSGAAVVAGAALAAASEVSAEADAASASGAVLEAAVDVVTAVGVDAVTVAAARGPLGAAM